MNSIVREYFDTHVQRGMGWIEVARELYETQFLIKSISKKEKELKERLQDLSDNVNSIGGGYTFSVNSRVGNVDYDAIEILRKIDLEQYRKPKCYYWTLKKI